MPSILSQDVEARLEAMEARGAIFDTLQLPEGPATDLPPPVGDVSVTGTSHRYALADHTHQSSFRATTKLVSGNGGVVTWTFDPPFASVPLAWAIVETSEGASQPFIVNQLGPATANEVKFLVFRAQTQTLGGTLAALIGAVINVFGFAPAGVKLNVFARKA